MQREYAFVSVRIAAAKFGLFFYFGVLPSPSPQSIFITFLVSSDLSTVWKCLENSAAADAASALPALAMQRNLTRGKPWLSLLDPDTLTGSLQGRAEREIAPSCWNQTGIELNHVSSSGGKFLELSSHRMPGLSWEGS